MAGDREKDSAYKMTSQGEKSKSGSEASMPCRSSRDAER